MDLSAVIESLLRGEDLSLEIATQAMDALMSGNVSDVQIAGFLVALRSKGATGSELAAFAAAMRDRSVRVPNPPLGLLDTCGTGGGIPSFNISTAAAIVASAAGVKIAKHGNRAMTSKCGSADVLEALGANLDRTPEQLERLLNTVGIAFLFAPSHHPAMRHVGPVRKALGVRTVFNQLGPLANPAGAHFQIIGVYDPAIAAAMAQATVALGVDRAWVVHGQDGMDEISPCGPTTVWEGDRRFELTPDQFGLDPAQSSALSPGETLEQSAEILLEAISRSDSPRFHAILPSAAAAIYLAAAEESLAGAADLARSVVHSGSAAAKLAEFVEASKA